MNQFAVLYGDRFTSLTRVKPASHTEFLTGPAAQAAFIVPSSRACYLLPRTLKLHFRRDGCHNALFAYEPRFGGAFVSAAAILNGDLTPESGHSAGIV